MRKILPSILTPTLSMLILTLGNGFFTTITTIALKEMHGSTWLIGLVSSAYFIGLMAGSYHSQAIVNRVGHIRAYAAFAALMTVSALLQGVWSSPWLWVVLRLITGYALAGLFIVIESWLLAKSSDYNKGRILALYLLVYYIAQAASQFLLKIPFETALMAFVTIAVLSCISIIPVSMTKVMAPEIETHELASIRSIFKKAPLGIWAGLVAGAFLGVIYAMYPLFLVQIHLSRSDIAVVMALTVLGGALLQIPIGRLSDMMDRRKVLLGVCLLLVGVAALMLVIPHRLLTLSILSFFMGGLAFTVYPLSISHTSDNIAVSQAVGVISILTLLYGFGSAIGPIVLPVFMGPLGPYGFFIYMLSVAALLSVYIVWRLFRREPTPVQDRSHFVSTVPETAMAAEELAEQFHVPIGDIVESDEASGD